MTKYKVHGGGLTMTGVPGKMYGGSGLSGLIVSFHGFWSCLDIGALDAIRVGELPLLCGFWTLLFSNIGTR